MSFKTNSDQQKAAVNQNTLLSSFINHNQFIFSKAVKNIRDILYFPNPWVLFIIVHHGTFLDA